MDETKPEGTVPPVTGTEEPKKRTRKPRDPAAPKAQRKTKQKRAPKAKDVLMYQIGTLVPSKPGEPESSVVWNDDMLTLTADRRKAWRREVAAVAEASPGTFNTTVRVRIIAVKDEFPLVVESKAKAKIG